MIRAKKVLDREKDVIPRPWREAISKDCLAHLINDATRAMYRTLQMRLSEHSISVSQWTFLRVLWESEGITQRELGLLAGVMEPSTSAAVHSMEKLGYVTRKKMPRNKKIMFIFLTQKGRLLKEKLMPLAEEVSRIAVENVKPGDIALMRSVLLAILENFDRHEARHKGICSPFSWTSGRN